MAKFSFSYSRWSLYSKCPQAYKYQHIDKIDTGPPAPALKKGRIVHDEVADYVSQKVDAMPEYLSKFTKLANDIRAIPAENKHVEEQMAFDRDCKPVSWFGPNAYYRFIWDVGIKNTPNHPTHIDAVDWKTGKPYGSYDDQKQMFALPAFWMNPTLETFTGHWVYLDHGEVHETTFERSQMGQLHNIWVGNAAMMESDRAFLPTPSRDACKFCEFGKKNLRICKEDVS